MSKFLAKNIIQVDLDTFFQPGEEVTGLSEDQMKSLWDMGVLQEIPSAPAAKKATAAQVEKQASQTEQSTGGEEQQKASTTTIDTNKK